MLSQRWPRNAPHIWVPWKFSGLPDYAHGYFSQNISWAFVPIDPVNMRTKFEVRSFARSWDNRRLKFRVEVANLQSRKWGGHRGSVRYRSKERWWFPIGPIVTFTLSLHTPVHVSEILPLLFSGSRHFSLPQWSWLSHVHCPMSNVSIIFYVLISWSLFSLQSSFSYSAQQSALTYI